MPAYTGIFCVEANVNNIITSVSNPIIIDAKKLLDKKYRKLYNAVLLEGAKFIFDAFDSKLPILKVFVLSNKFADYKDFIEKANCPYYLIDEHLVKYLSESESPQGLFAEFDITKKMSRLKPPDSNFLVLDCLQDPGNLGTIVRTATACDFNTIYLINSVDFLSSKVIRSSAGTIFKINVYNISYEELLTLVKQHKLTLVSADMKGENIYSFSKELGRFGIVIGNEGNGISQTLKQACKYNVSLPMKNNVESLNAGVSASVLMYLMQEVK